ncbi:MAG: DUF4340 domain-containing protein [Opitutus sp.]
MKLRTVIVTVAVLAVLSAIVAFVRRPAPPPLTDIRLNQPLVDRAAIEKATKLRLTDAGKTVELVRQADGTWRVPSYYDLPADFSKLSGFVSNLTDAKLQRLVTANPERLARLEFKDTKIELLDNAGKDLGTIVLGKAAESGGRYVRFGAEQKAYLANFQAWLDADAKNWADATLLNVKPEDVTKIELSFPQGEPVTLSRAKKDAAWTATPSSPNQTLNTEKISSLLSSLGNLRFTETTEPTDANAIAAKAHPQTARLTTFDGKTYQIALGRKPEEKKLKVPGSNKDDKSGPGALGKLGDLNTKDAAPKTGDTPATDNKPMTPEFDTVPAGPVFVSISSSDATAPVNSLMQKRAFQVAEYAFTSLPHSAAELFTAPPTVTPAAAGTPPPTDSSAKAPASSTPAASTTPAGPPPPQP